MNRTHCLALVLPLLLAACGGEAVDNRDSVEFPGRHARPAFAQAPGSADTVILSGNSTAFTVTRTDSGYSVTDAAGVTRSYPSSVTRFVFSDRGLAFDVDGNAGMVYRLYQAAFDREPDLPGIGFWLDMLDNGGSLYDVAAGFHGSDEFRNLYGAAPANADLVTRYYQNVLQRAPDPAGHAWWLGLLDSGQMSAAQVLAGFSESAENKARLQARVQNGIAYIPWAVTSATLTPSTLSACPSDMATVFFNTSPVALADFIAFRPLGFLSTPIHMFPAKHSAFSMTAIGETAVPKPVVAPGRVFVTEIYEASFSTGGKNYQVFLRPCEEVRAYFGHLATISDKLRAEFDKQAASCNSFNDGSSTVTTCRRENMALLLEEGEQFGTGPDSAGVDFGVLDFRRTPAAFINLAHYDHYYPYYTSPLDYFGTATKQQIEAKTGSVFGDRMRTALPVGGTYMEDLPGTAQGNWFLPGRYHSNTTDLSVFLGLAHDYTDPSQPVIAMGSSVPGMTSGLYSFTTQASGVVNRDFSAVKADGLTYCFDNFLSGRTAGGMPLGSANGMLLMAMPDAESLKVEFVSGGSCSAAGSQAFSGSAATFVR